MTEIYTTQSSVHRSGVTAVDAADPADAGGAVDTRGYHECRFDIAIAGVSLTSLEVQVLFWNARQEVWMRGGKRTFDNTGKYAVVVDARGAKIFLKVTAFTGTSFSLAADYSLS
ncbi:MAG: hypothetical protein PHR56_06515 [Dehalococcoidales bacterium]|nr:hypothetical protein [Dehalococcoidales bacterium]